MAGFEGREINPVVQGVLMPSVTYLQNLSDKIMSSKKPVGGYVALAISLSARLGKRQRESPIEDATPSRPTSQSLSFRSAAKSFGASCVVPADLKKDKPEECIPILQEFLDRLISEQLVTSER